jgi:uncharacterized protein YicC (UPF0701 family)
VNDRSYYRTLPLRTLIEAARDSGDELAIALAERLDDLEHELEEGARKDFKALSEAYDDVCRELSDCREELDQHIYEG